MISAGALASMQRTVQGAMTTPCQVLRKSAVSDGAGGFVDTWSTVQSTVCYVAPAAGAAAGTREAEALGRIEEQNRFIVRLPAGTDVDIKDRIAALGVTYEVTSVQTPRTMEIARLVNCVQVVS
jgi:hypothetical protein